MSTEKMRHDFEQFIIRRDGSIWVTVMGDQRSYNEPIERDFYVWCESRSAIEIQLPKIRDFYGSSSECEEGYEVWEVQEAIESIGLKVKP
jgi:hypothetical protein